MAEHTPGPYTVISRGGNVHVSGKHGVLVAGCGPDIDPECWANAKRIKLALECFDDLLAACEKQQAALNVCARCFCGTCDVQPGPGTMAQAVAAGAAAIAKAKGE